MTDWGGSPRKVNLIPSGDYFSKPTDKFLEWLEGNAASLRLLSEDQIIRRGRTTLGPDLSRLNDSDLAAHIRGWAKRHGFVLPGGSVPPPISAGDPEVVDRLKKLFASIPTQVKWVPYPGNGTASISVSGFTRTVDSGKTQTAVSLGWDGAIQFKTQTSGMTFTASVGPQTWSMTFAFGRMVPDIAHIEGIFKKGEPAIRSVLSNLDKVDFRDPGKTKTLFSPYFDPIKTAIDAAAKAAALRPGVNFGAWVQGGVPGTPGAGTVSGGAGLVITF